MELAGLPVTKKDEPVKVSFDNKVGTGIFLLLTSYLVSNILLITIEIRPDEIVFLPVNPSCITHYPHPFFPVLQTRRFKRACLDHQKEY